MGDSVEDAVFTAESVARWRGDGVAAKREALGITLRDTEGRLVEVGELAALMEGEEVAVPPP